MDKRIAVMRCVFGACWNDIDLVTGNVVSHHVAAVVTDPEIASAGLPVEPYGITNAMADNRCRTGGRV